LLEKETDKTSMNSILEEILQERQNITEEKDFEYLKSLFETLAEKKAILTSESSFKQINWYMKNFIENTILSGEISIYFEYFLENLKDSTLDVNTYLEKIFTESIITPYILKAFFHFHEEFIFYFNLNLDQKSNDTKFLEKICDSLKYVDEPMALMTLKYIYQIKNKAIKVKVLTAMQEQREYDIEFLMPIVKKRGLSLRKEALVVLVRDESARKEAFKRLLAIPSPYGICNRKILKNIKIIEEKNLRVAEDYLIALSKRKSIWNKNVRKRSQSLLDE
jgi:hypothetical protein